MKSIKANQLLSLIFIFILSSSFDFAILISQPKTQIKLSDTCSKPKIEWIEEISSETINSSAGGFLETLYNFIVGSDDLTILKPFDLVTDKEGSIYFIDQDNKKIIKYIPNKDEIVSLIEDDIELKSPVSLCLFENNLVFTDSELNKIFIYNFDSEETSVLNSSLEQPTGIIYLENIQEFWVCETHQHRIVRLDKKGDIIETFGRRGKEQGQFNFPTFIESDRDGNVYVNDSMNFRIQIFSSDRNFIKQFGNAGDGSGDFARPKGIAIDSFNNIYVVDALFNNVQVFDQQGSLLYSFGEKGTDSGMFWLPTGIFIDQENKIFVADSFNSRIQIFQLSCEK